MTGQGQAAVFVAVDHCSAECVGVHASRRADRFEALEPVRRAVRERFGAFAKGVAAGLQLETSIYGANITTAAAGDDLQGGWFPSTGWSLAGRAPGLRLAAGFRRPWPCRSSQTRSCGRTAPPSIAGVLSPFGGGRTVWLRAI